MKGSTLLAIVLGSAAIFGSFIMEGGKPAALLVIPAMVIVFGGTLAAAMAGSSLQHVLRIPTLLRIAFFPPTIDHRTIIEQILLYATIARRDGILGLERRLDEIEHPFLRKLIETSVDGADPDTMIAIAETDIEFITERHNSNIALFTKMGGYSPTMGIIGTVMGLISTLAAAGGDPTELIHHIATAFIATMWGIFMANIVFLPIADKLRSIHTGEIQLMNIMIIGVSALQLGETPSVIRSKLISAFPLIEQNELRTAPLPIPSSTN